MTEAPWADEAKTPPIDWRVSAALENVPRGDGDVADVTSLEGAVRAWAQLDPEHRTAAVLTIEHPLQINGAAMLTLCGEGIAVLVERLPSTGEGR
ncbi:hypothetical protein Q4F19_06940 [Sphingomonas sp. BIUV-7]|uniref:Uncharacterized protein n=1 Tax=Sphingomonas natans TaxID=3063330 RepID=A0ABT8Y737_9SPHN|nr:hypothetical protein [Sphingomonas sp. BIUV-7]MDO6414111.1 hypothetical protein [Sphingomonas sp. BIUV-7]